MTGSPKATRQRHHDNAAQVLRATSAFARFGAGLGFKPTEALGGAMAPYFAWLAEEHGIELPEVDAATLHDFGERIGLMGPEVRALVEALAKEPN